MQLNGRHNGVLVTTLSRDGSVDSNTSVLVKEITNKRKFKRKQSPTPSTFSTKSLIPVLVQKNFSNRYNDMPCIKPYTELVKENEDLHRVNEELNDEVNKLRSHLESLLVQLNFRYRHEPLHRLPPLRNTSDNEKAIKEELDYVKKRLDRELHENRKLKRCVLMHSTKYLQIKKDNSILNKLVKPPTKLPQIVPQPKEKHGQRRTSSFLL